jgi:hypothetical protein
MKKQTLLLSLVIVCSFIVSACSEVATDCNQEEVIAAVDQLDSFLSKFNDQVELVSSTEKSALPDLISELEAVLQEVQVSEVPNCIQLVKDKLIQYMATMNDGLQLYATDNPESEVFEKIEQATDLMGEYIIASLEARVGTPTPQP